jgi:hypothetical protein
MKRWTLPTGRVSLFRWYGWLLSCIALLLLCSAGLQRRYRLALTILPVQRGVMVAIYNTVNAQDPTGSSQVCVFVFASVQSLHMFAVNLVVMPYPLRTLFDILGPKPASRIPTSIPVRTFLVPIDDYCHLKSVAGGGTLSSAIWKEGYFANAGKSKQKGKIKEN